MPGLLGTFSHSALHQPPVPLAFSDTQHSISRQRSSVNDDSGLRKTSWKSPEHTDSVNSSSER